MDRRKRNSSTLGGAEMKNIFKCGDCGAEFSTPIKRFDNGLKVCPACLSFITEDAFILVRQKTEWLKRAKSKTATKQDLKNLVFPVDTKTIFEDE